MYEIDELDSVLELMSVPQMEPGAPAPVILAEEGALVLSYELRDQILEQPTKSPVAIVRFLRPRFHLFGLPNDEALKGHPLAERGLAPYGAFRVIDSSLIRRLERMNRVHEHHNPARYRNLIHYIFTFHDSTFECVAEALTVSIEHIRWEQLQAKMLAALRSA